MKTSDEIDLFSREIEEKENLIEKEVKRLSRKISFYTTLAWILIAIGAIVALVPAIWSDAISSDTNPLSVLGDFWSGSVASIWSLAGLFFIYVAFLGQKQQLLNQQLEIMHSQLELKYTREELAGQREEMASQNSTLKQQKFENTFFNLLSLHHQIVSNIDEIEERSAQKSVLYNPIKDEPIQYIVIRGRDVFKSAYQRFQDALEHNDRNHHDVYMEEYEKVQTDFGHYFRNLYRIIKFIDGTIFTKNSDENYKAQYQYTSMVRAQLSDYELLWLFYNCLSDNGIEKFKPLVEKYCLFKNIPKDKIHDQKIISQYVKNAFDKEKIIN